MVFILILNCINLCTKQCQASLKDNDCSKYTPSRSLNVINVLNFLFHFICVSMFLFVFPLWLVFWVDEWEGKKEGYTSYRTCSINTLFYLFNLDCPITRTILRIIFDQCNTREKEVGKQALISVWRSQFALCSMETKTHLVLCQCCVGTSVLPRESGSTVAGSVKHSIPITLARKKGTPVRMENCANLSISLPNLDSLLQHCGVLSWLLGDSDSAYFNKNTYNFLAIQTFICMQGIALASAVGQWCWASAQGELWWNLNAFNGTQSSRQSSWLWLCFSV